MSLQRSLTDFLRCQDGASALRAAVHAGALAVCVIAATTTPAGAICPGHENGHFDTCQHTDHCDNHSNVHENYCP